MKLHHVHVVNVEVIHSFEITLHAIWKLLVDQFNNFIVLLIFCAAPPCGGNRARYSFC